MPSNQTIQTPITDLLGITHPIMLAGMGTAAGPSLAAAVTNAGGIGVIGGIGYTPSALREAIAELKSKLNDPSAPFGVDLLLPQVGGTARKTNYDYTKGHLDELISVIIETGTKVFVSAVGVPPQGVVDRLHAGGVLYMNMIGHPRHVAKCLARGVDIVCAQGSEGGGHTGDVPTSVLVPAVARLLRGAKSPLTGQPVPLVAAGGVYCGESLAAALMLGASAVWVGTRFVVAREAGASRAHQEAVTTAGIDDTVRTIIFSGRPLRVRKTKYILDWEENRQEEIKALTARGILPVEHDADNHPDDPEILDNAYPYLMGVCAAEIKTVQTAAEIVDEMMSEAAGRLAVVTRRFTPKL
ncbi:2-nitropropane dioxygenase [Aspergillus ambiguus]|uniref:NAD(P)H-dependent flavin oxidoreductase n=1 Tax=Aspergillus ambiguus TaxID=176160 RepID=UPI003CCDCA1C